MNIVDIALIAAGVGTCVSLILLFDAWADVRAARGDARLVGLTRTRLTAEAFRLAAQASFLAAALVAKYRVPGTFQWTLRWLLVAVPILLAIGSVVSWYSKRRLLRNVDQRSDRYL